MAYKHNNKDPNLNNLHHAMVYRDNEPHIRVDLGSDSITITGDVNILDNIRVNNTEEQSIPVHLTDDPIAVTQSTSPWVISKDTNINSSSNPIYVNFTNGTIGVTGTFWQATQPVSIATMPTTPVTGTFWQATQPVSIATMPTTPVTGTFWQATQPVSGTVTIQDGGNTITVDGTVTANVTFPTTQQVSGTVALDSNSLSALENINATVSGTVELGSTTLTALENVGVTGTVTVQDGGGSITVDGTVSATVSGTVELGASTLSALENTTVTISGTPTVNIGTIPEVEIKNDAGNPIPVSATTAANSALNPIYIAGNVSTIGGSAQGKLWFFQIAQGLIPGHIPVFKAGYNPSVANNSEESIWAHSELYPWSAWGAGGTLSCVSASASDVGTLQIVGLRASDWTQVTETVTMTGVTPVVTTNSFIRVNNVHYSHTSSNVGEIHVNRAGTCVAHIDAGNGQGQMAQYTVPAGYTAYLLTGNANLGKGNDGTGKFRYRLYGSSFQTAMTFLLFQSTFNYTFEAPLALPEKTDLDVTLIASVSGTAVTCAYSMILIQNGL